MLPFLSDLPHAQHPGAESENISLQGHQADPDFDQFLQPFEVFDMTPDSMKPKV